MTAVLASDTHKIPRQCAELGKGAACQFQPRADPGLLDHIQTQQTLTIAPPRAADIGEIAAATAPGRRRQLRAILCLSPLVTPSPGTLPCPTRAGPKHQMSSPMCDATFASARAIATSWQATKIALTRRLIMKPIIPALLALSLLAAIAAPAAAYDPSVGPPTAWTPHDPSPPGSPPG
jgi:hypothetical protein